MRTIGGVVNWACSISPGRAGDRWSSLGVFPQNKSVRSCTQEKVDARRPKQPPPATRPGGAGAQGNVPPGAAIKPAPGAGVKSSAKPEPINIVDPISRKDALAALYNDE